MPPVIKLCREGCVVVDEWQRFFQRSAIVSRRWMSLAKKAAGLAR